MVRFAAILDSLRSFRPSRRQQPAGQPLASRRCRPALETLEDRAMPSLAAPILPGPTSVQNARPTFSWIPVGGAASYDLWVDDATSGQSQVVGARTAVPMFTMSDKAAPLVPGHVYSWWARADDFAGNPGPWGGPAQLTITPLAVPKPALVGFTSTAPAYFNWAAVAGANTYDFWLDDLTTGQAPLVHVPAATNLLYSPVSLTAGHAYEYFVRAFANNGDYSAWSAPFNFTVQRLDVPTTVGPKGTVSGGTAATVSVPFTWSYQLDAAAYDLWLDDTSTGVSQVYRNGSIASNSVTISLSAGHAYQWWVRPIGLGGTLGNWSAGASFQLTLPVLLPVAPSGTITATTATFSWSGFTAHADLWVDDLTIGQSAWYRNPNVTGNSFTFAAPLTGGHTYKWYLRNYVPGGYSGPWTTGTSFTVARIAPELHGPVPLSNGTEVFAWTDVPGGTNATTYDIWVDDKTTGQSQFYRNKLVLATLGAGDNVLTVSSIFQANHLYWWWVRANGIGDWSMLSGFVYSPPAN